MLRFACTKMDKRFTTSISFIVIQACFIISALYMYVIPFGSMLWRSLNGSDQVTVAKIASSILPLKKSLLHKEIEYSVSNIFNSNTPSAFVQPEYRDNFKMYLICQIPKTRLGNHMFSFATSFGIAHALNYTFVMRSSSPLLKYFELNQTLVKRIENVQKITITQWKQNTWNKTNQPGNLTLEGYWRDWKYFASISGNIRKSFTFKSKFLNVAKRFIRSHNPNNTTLIGVHVRRGDFLRQETLKKGRVVVHKDYLLKAMNWFRRQHKDACFIVVSDDKKWCRINIPGKDVIFSNYTEPMHDMAILSLCNHVVISTGTFGWWGAWLAGGTVVYCSDYPRPGSYLANHTLFREDYYPPSWIGTFWWWGAWLAGGTVVYCSDFLRPGSYLANHTFFREDYYPPSWIGVKLGQLFAKMTIRMPLTLNRFSLVFASVLAIPIYYTWMYYYSSAKGQRRRENTVFNNTTRSNQYESVVEPGLMQIVNMDEYGHSKLQSRARLNVRVDPRILSTDKTQQILRDSIELFHSNKFIKPPNEVCEKRPPSAIVIGVQKSGTRELMDFMHLHPHIQIYHKKHYEMSYFSRRYNKSMDWFKKQMPCSFSNQITVMKNSGYFHMDTVDVPERIRKFNASIKLILIVREPIARSHSAYTFFKARRGYKESFGEMVINAIKNKKQELPKLLKMSIYDESMKRWLQVFNLSQILIIDHSEFKQDPISVLVKVEEFLGLGHYITTDMFLYNAVTGFQCIRSNLTTTGMSCYASDRGRPQDPISREIKSKLTGYFKPANERFFGIIGRPFNW